MWFRTAGIIVTLLGVSFPSYGAETRYHYVEVALGESEVNVRGSDTETRAVAILGSFDGGKGVYLRLGYTYEKLDFYSAAGSLLQLGLGSHKHISANTSVFVEAFFLRADLDYGGYDSQNETGYSLDLGLRHRLSGRVELNALLGTTDLYDQTLTGFDVGARFFLSDRFSVGGAYSKVEDTTGGLFSFRWDL